MAAKIVFVLSSLALVLSEGGFTFRGLDGKTLTYQTSNVALTWIKAAKVCGSNPSFYLSYTSKALVKK